MNELLVCCKHCGCDSRVILYENTIWVTLIICVTIIAIILVMLLFYNNYKKSKEITDLLHDVSNKGRVNHNMDSRLFIVILFYQHFHQQFCHRYIFASDRREYNRHECGVRFPSNHSFVLCCPLQETLPSYSNSQETLWYFSPLLTIGD